MLTTAMRRPAVRGKISRAPQTRLEQSNAPADALSAGSISSMKRKMGKDSVSSDDIEDPDRALVEQAQAELPYGTTAYNELVRKYSGRVYGRAYGILRSSADAEEAVQDVFLAVFRNLPRFRFERPFLHWLNTVSLNACRMILRKRASEQRRRQSAEEQAPPPEKTEAPDVALRKLVLELLDALDPGRVSRCFYVMSRVTAIRSWPKNSI